MATIQIENLKCGGCANTIKKGILSISGINNVDINLDNSEVNIDSDDASILKTVKEKLSKMGYPEMGDPNSIMKKAKSYVSCAVGRMSKEE